MQLCCAFRLAQKAEFLLEKFTGVEMIVSLVFLCSNEEMSPDKKHSHTLNLCDKHTDIVT